MCSERIVNIKFKLLQKRLKQKDIAEELDVSESYISLLINGEAAWNRKYGMYIDRDYSKIRC